MIFVTGDTHGGFGERFNVDAFPEQKEMTKNDYLIICGDFGGIWYSGTQKTVNKYGESKEEKYWLDWFETRNFTLLFIDGNHENYDRLYAYPEKEWNGGVVHEIRPHVLHLTRGQVFTIDGYKFFTFGGARSHDIDGGVFEIDDPDFSEKVKMAERYNECYRVNHVSWWKEEMPNEKEMELGKKNLEINENRVDFILSHDCPSSTLALYGHGLFKSDPLNFYLEDIRSSTEYRNWFFGHYHENKNITYKDVLLYEQLIRIC